MGTVTMQGIVYDGAEWPKDPTGEAGDLLELGCRQYEVYDPMYGSKLLLKSPNGGLVKPGDTVVSHNGNWVGHFKGDILDKAAPVAAAKPKKAKKATKKSA